MSNQITITISGSEGIGKSMIGCALAEALAFEGHIVEVTDDVGTEAVSPAKLGEASITATAEDYRRFRGERNPVKIIIGVNP